MIINYKFGLSSNVLFVFSTIISITILAVSTLLSQGFSRDKAMYLVDKVLYDVCTNLNLEFNMLFGNDSQFLRDVMEWVDMRIQLTEALMGYEDVKIASQTMVYSFLIYLFTGLFELTLLLTLLVLTFTSVYAFYCIIVCIISPESLFEANPIEKAIPDPKFGSEICFKKCLVDGLLGIESKEEILKIHSKCLVECYGFLLSGRTLVLKKFTFARFSSEDDSTKTEIGVVDSDPYLQLIAARTVREEGSDRKVGFLLSSHQRYFNFFNSQRSVLVTCQSHNLKLVGSIPTSDFF